MNQPAKKCGFVAVVGLPNVGKSTLVNVLLGEKVSIVSPKPQTTRHRIHGIIHRPQSQIILVDTPGLCAPESALHRLMRHTAGQAAQDADMALLVVEARDGLPSDSAPLEQVVQTAKKARGALVVALNKIDRLARKESLLPWIEALQKTTDAAAIVPISAKRRDGLDILLSRVEELLPEGVPLFPSDMHTDQAERFLCAELVREQLLFQTRDEVPHRAAVVIELFEDLRDDERKDGGLCRLEGRIYVERQSQKAIVVGKKGSRIKQVSEEARKQIEELLGSKVYLRLTVHVAEDWTKQVSRLRDFGIAQDEG